MSARHVRTAASGASRTPAAAGEAGAPATLHWSALASRLRWPLPALVAWTLAWGVYVLALGAGCPAGLAALGAGALAAAIGLVERSAWRRAIMATGFPLSWWLQCAPAGTDMATGLPSWLWLLPAGLLLLAYPLRAWRDAPFFPTPAHALSGLTEVVSLPAQARVLDAGCGLGHGLRALRGAYPDARLHGVEWSWPLWLLTWLRCPWAQVRRGDMWKASWRDCELVYLFQRPESMPRAVDKALREMRPGSWVVSLEFKAEGLRLHAVLQREGQRPVWVYRIAAALPPRGSAT